MGTERPEGPRKEGQMEEASGEGRRAEGRAGWQREPSRDRNQSLDKSLSEAAAHVAAGSLRL